MEEDYSNLSDEELIKEYQDSLSAGPQRQTATEPPMQAAQTPEKPDYDRMSDEELISAYQASLLEPQQAQVEAAAPDVVAPPQGLASGNAARTDRRLVGNAGAPMRPEDFADEPAMGGVELQRLRDQADGAPVAAPSDGSFTGWLRNLGGVFAHNTSGRVAERNIEMNTQDILRGTVRKDGKDVPLTELPDSELDYLVDAAGWNGAGAWFKRFLGPWARSGSGMMQEWDRTEGAKIADPSARKSARVRYAQEMARNITLQNEREKRAAQAEIEGREKQWQAGLTAGLAQTGSYMFPFLAPHVGAVLAGVIGGADRGQEMASDRYEMDEDGNVYVAAERDSTGTAIAKGVARGIVEPAVEMVGGAAATKALGGLAGATLGRIPLVKSVGGKIARTAAGKALSKYGKTMDRLGKMIGLQGAPEEAIEEFEDSILDAALGIDRRESEKQGVALQRAGEAAKEFFKPESLKNLAESMLLVQILGGGIAHVNDRYRSKPIDNILSESAGIDKAVLRDYTADEKWAAYEAYVNGLTEEQVRKKLGKGADAVNELADVIARGTTEVDDFRRSAYAMMDEDGAKSEGGLADAQMRQANAQKERQYAEDMAAPFARADAEEAEMGARIERQGEAMRRNASATQEQSDYDRMMEAREEARAQNRAEAAVEGAGARGAERTGEETGAAENAPEGLEAAFAEAQTEPPPPEVVDRPNRLRRQQPNNFRHPGDNRLRPTVPDIDQQPIRETKDETGNVRDEAPAEPAAQDVGRDGQQPPPEAGARPVEGAAQGAEAPDAGVVGTPAARKPKGRRGENLRGYTYEDYGAPPNTDAATRHTEPGGTGDEIGASLLRYVKENGRLLNIPQSKDDPLWDWYQSFNDGNARRNRRGDFIALFGMNPRKGRNDNFIEEMSDPALSAYLKGVAERRGVEAVPEMLMEARRKYGEWAAKKRAAAKEAKRSGTSEDDVGEVMSLDEIAARDAADAEYDNAFAEVERYEADTPVIRNFSRKQMRTLKRGDVLRFDHADASWDVVDYDVENDVVTVVPGGALGNPLMSESEIASEMVQYRVSADGIQEIKPEKGNENGRENKRGASEAVAGDAQGAPARTGADAQGGAGQQAPSGAEGDFALESATAEELNAEQERNRQRAEIKKRQEAPLKGSGAVNVQPEMDFGQTGQQDIFSPIAEKPKTASAAAPEKTEATTPPKAAKPAEGGKSASGGTEADYQNWLKRFNLPDTEIRRENWFNQFSKDESVRSDALDYVRTMERWNGEGSSTPVDGRATPPVSAQERIAKSYADYVEEPVPEWAKRLSAKDAEEYAQLLEDAQRRGGEDDGGDAIDALEAFERAHDNRLRPEKDARGTRGKEADTLSWPTSGLTGKGIPDRDDNGKATAATGSSAKRRYTKEPLVFRDPYVGKTGAKLTSYLWENKPEEYIDMRGEERTRRVSDWDNSEVNPFTRRGIVHQFTVETSDGNIHVVSAETAAHLLGVSESTIRTKGANAVKQAIEQARMRKIEAEAKKMDADNLTWLNQRTTKAALDAFYNLANKGKLRVSGKDGMEHGTVGVDEDGTIRAWANSSSRLLYKIHPDGSVEESKTENQLASRSIAIKTLEKVKSVPAQSVAAETPVEDARSVSHEEKATEPSDGADAPQGGKSASGETPAEWPKGWEHGKSLDGYAKATDADISALKPGDEVAVAHTSGGESRAKQAVFAKVRSVGKEYDGNDNVDVFIGDYKDGWGYDQDARFKKSEIIGIRRVAANPVPAAPTPEMRWKATAAMRILGADAGKDAAALEAELRRMEERGQAASGPGRRKADALRDLAAYKRAVGTKEVPAEEIAEGRQRDAEQRIIEGEGDTLPSEDFYGRRQSRGNGEMPAKWTEVAKRPLERVARALRNVVTVGGKKLKVLFADRPADVDDQTRKSIGGVFTGTAADYANRSRQGGRDDGPSVKKIGTGEGSQVYGWGLYGSTERGVAEGYAGIGETLYRNKNTGEIRSLEFGPKYKPMAMGDYDYYSGNVTPKAAKNGWERISGQEHLYEQTFFTNRAPGDESHLLKWYEPVSEEQFGVLRKAGLDVEEKSRTVDGETIRRVQISKDGKLLLQVKDTSEITGEDLYRLVAKSLGSEEAASEFLYRAGIDGVKYPVDSYGGKGVKDGDKAGWNYVTFSDENIRVDHKWTDGKLRYMRNGDGVAVGEYDADRGEIRLYPGATVADVVHEFTHPLVDFARAEAKAGRGELLGKMREVIDAERATWEEPVREAYADKGEGEILEEIFTHAMGDKGADLFGKSTTTLEGRRWYNRLWDAIKGLWQDFATKMGWNRADLRGLDDMSPEAAAQRILSEMAKGRSFGDAVTGGEGTRNAVRNGVSAEEGTRYSRRVSPPGGNGGGATLFSSTSPVDVNEKETFVQKVQRKLQDYRAVIKRTEERLGVTDKGRSLYYALDRVFGKTRDEAHRLAKGKVEPMLRKLVEAGAAMGKRFDATGGAEVGLDDYLYAMHAKERNDVLASRPDARVSADGSGMSEAKAQSILSAFAAMPEAKRRAIEDAAQTVWDINDSRLDRLVASGRMSQDEADGLRRTYRHYVPLRTDMEAMGEDLFNTGTSGWSKSEFRRALGRTTEADSPTVFSLMQAEDAIAGANKNEARQRLYDMVTAHPELGRIRRMDKLTRKWSYTHGEETLVADERYNERDRDDIVMVKRGGTLYAIELDGALGKRLAAAVTSRNLARFPDELSIIPKATRTMAEMRTQLVPTFLLRNMKADHLEVFLNSIGDMGFMGASRFLGRTERHFVSADAHKAIQQYFTTGKVDTSTDAGRLFNEYVKTGSLIGGGNRQGYADTATELNDIIDDMVRGKANPKRWGKAAKECVSTLNEHIETGTRFGVYWTCREMGMSPEEAASYSRDLTTNFNRKGEWTPVTNSLFMFSNAAIQGLARASKSMNPKMSKNAYQSLMTIGAIGVMGALWRHFLGSDDERRRKGEGDPSFDTDYDKANYIRFGWGGTSLSLKERYPWAAVKYAAEKLTEFALGDCTKGDLVKGLGENVVEAMLQEPFGHGGTAAQTVTPSVFVPITQILEGKDFRGEDMYARKFDESKPDSSNGKRSTSGVYKGIAQGLNWLTGGNAHRQGGIDLAPETVKTVAETIGGGVWTDVTRVTTLLERAYDSIKSGKNEFELRDIPFLGDAVKKHRGPEAKYYEAIKAYNRDKYELKNTKDASVRRELRKGKPYLFMGKSLLDGRIEQIKELGHLERGEVKSGRKWVEPSVPRSEAQKEAYRKRRLHLQALVLKTLGG